MMWNPILDVAGWGLFYFLLIFFVRWIGIERAFFAGQDPERWKPEPPSEVSPADAHAPKPVVQLPFISSLGRPV